MEGPTEAALGDGMEEGRLAAARLGGVRGARGPPGRRHLHGAASWGRGGEEGKCGARVLLSSLSLII